MQIAKCKLQIASKPQRAQSERSGCEEVLGGAVASKLVYTTRSDRHPCQEKCGTQRADCRPLCLTQSAANNYENTAAKNAADYKSGKR